MGGELANSATSLEEPFKASLWVLALSLSFDEDDLAGLEDMFVVCASCGAWGLWWCWREIVYFGYLWLRGGRFGKQLV